MKNTFKVPFVLPIGGGGGDGLIGDGSNQGHYNFVPPISFDGWKDSEYADAFRSDSGAVSFDDYRAWWNSMMEIDPSAYSSSTWSQLNPGKLWEN